LAKDFDGLRALLLEYARLYYPDRTKDFSEASLGGLFLDFAAYVGDNLSFYLDHQFSELDPDLAVESVNIQRALRQAGVPIVGAAPATAYVTFLVKVPAVSVNGVMVPRTDAIPVIQYGSIVEASNGVPFTLMSDLDFTLTDDYGKLRADVRIGDKTSNGTPQTFILALTGECVSGQENTEQFSLGSFIPFRQIVLANSNVNEILTVTDSLGNVYHEVSSLTNDVVYRAVPGPNPNDLSTLQVIPAPYRYVTSVDLDTRKTTLTFGGGDAETLEDDVIPDPTDFAIPLKHTRTFSRIQVNPQQMLQSKTLGVATSNSTVTIVYRSGGGLNHNVEHDQIQIVRTLNMRFPNNPSAQVAASVRSSVEVTNIDKARGGDDAPTVDDLKALIPAMKNMQERIVTREDLLARVYSLPSSLGRVFRAAVRSNPNNPLASQLHIVSRDANGKLIVSPDTLKRNLVTYLNPYRMISDAIDILDAQIINLTLTFEILVNPKMNKSVVLQGVLRDLQTYFKTTNFNIDQPMNLDDVRGFIFANSNVVSVNSLQFKCVSGLVNNVTYSNTYFDVQANTTKNFIVPPAGGIFEIKYPEIDIVGKAV
jgi:hypothetical protein